MIVRLALVVLTVISLGACSSVRPPHLQPHVTPRGVVIKNLHPAPAAQEQQDRSVAGPPWWPRSRP